jgi:hypothetical protein
MLEPMTSGWVDVAELSSEHTRAQQHRELFKERLSGLIGEFGAGNGDTPNCILADYLIGCLDSFTSAASGDDKSRER